MSTTVKTAHLLSAVKSVLPFVPNKKLQQKNLQNILVKSSHSKLSLAATDGVAIGYCEIPVDSGTEFAFLLSTKEDQQKSLETVLKACTLDTIVMVEKVVGELHFEGLGVSFSSNTLIGDYPNLDEIFIANKPQPGSNFNVTAAQLEKLAKAAKAFDEKKPVYEMVFNGDNQAILVHLKYSALNFKSLLMPDSG